MRDRPELVFTHWAVRALKDLRGERWRALVERIAALDETHPDALAFALMIARLSNCTTCNASRYLERGGCAQCARMVLTTLHKESEDALLARFRAAQKDIAQVSPYSQRKAA